MKGAVEKFEPFCTIVCSVAAFLPFDARGTVLNQIYSTTMTLVSSNKKHTLHNIVEVFLPHG